MSNSLNIVLLHYHLNRGGVTRVIENQLRSLNQIAVAKQPIQVLLLYGGRQAAWPDDFAEQVPNISLQLQVISDLEYSSDMEYSSKISEHVINEVELAEAIANACKEQEFVAENTVIHAHNHSIGKNALLPGALKLLAEAGFGLLLQIHDFAEEFRPANYQLLREAIATATFSETLYPQGNRIHYATLNNRDRQRLLQAGAWPEHLHFLPNPVSAFSSSVEPEFARQRLLQLYGIQPDEQFLLYPVRGIRRKNLGELLLHAVLSPTDHHFGITLAPLNPQERIYYDRWKQKAEEWKLRCHFGMGEADKLSFEENMAAADSIFTTSIAEGFGMVYLESWMLNRPLIGRDLPHVTHDFRESGLKLDALYQRINIPIEWIGRDVYFDKLSSAGERLLEAYQRDDLPDTFWDEVLQKKVINGEIDFSDLDEPLQETVLERLLQSATDCELLLKMNPQFEVTSVIEKRTIQQNQQIVQQQYSLRANGERLISLYSRILCEPVSPVTASVNSALLLDQFLDLTQLRLLQG